MSMGSDLSKAYIKFSNKGREHLNDDGDIYIGEWSKETNTPVGRGFFIYPWDHISIGYWNNGPRNNIGNFIMLRNDGYF